MINDYDTFVLSTIGQILEFVPGSAPSRRFFVPLLLQGTEEIIESTGEKCLDTFAFSLSWVLSSSHSSEMNDPRHHTTLQNFTSL